MKKSLPNFSLRNSVSGSDVGVNHFEDITSTGILHDNTKTVGTALKEGLFKFDDELVVKGGKNSDFVQSPIFFLIFHGSEFDFFHCIEDAILFPLDHEDLSESTFAEFPHDIEVL